MHCPVCKHHVASTDTVCPHCGESLVLTDSEVVFSGRKPKRDKSVNYTTIFIVLICIALVAGAGFIVYNVFFQKPKQESSVKPLSTAPTVATEAVAEPTPKTPGNAAEETDQQKLEKYINQSDLLENMLALAGDNMSLSTLRAEHNIIIAYYQVDFSSDDPQHQEYFETLPDTMSEICSRMDEDLYNIRKQTGVEDAQLQIICSDLGGNTLFSELV